MYPSTQPSSACHESSTPCCSRRIPTFSMTRHDPVLSAKQPAVTRRSPSTPNAASRRADATCVPNPRPHHAGSTFHPSRPSAPRWADPVSCPMPSTTER